MRLTKRLETSLLRKLLPAPASTRHCEYSMIFSADDEPKRPTGLLMDIALRAVSAAAEISLDAVYARTAGGTDFLNLWPGEHYRLLAGLVKVLQPTCVLDLGSGAGGSALSMKQALPVGSKIASFDLLAWDKLPEGIFLESDFSDGSVEHIVADLSQRAVLESQRLLFEQAELIFIDLAKDGVMEQTLIDFLKEVEFRNKRPLLVFDDIRVWSMLGIWRRLPWPKLDMTSFGHWTGTGFAQWCPVEETGQDTPITPVEAMKPFARPC